MPLNEKTRIDASECPVLVKILPYFCYLILFIHVRPNKNTMSYSRKRPKPPSAAELHSMKAGHPIHPAHHLLVVANLAIDVSEPDVSTSCGVRESITYRGLLGGQGKPSRPEGMMAS